MHRLCRDCKQSKPSTDFVRNHVFKDGIDTLCLECNRRRVKSWRKGKKDGRSKVRTRYISTEYREVIIDALVKRDGFTCGRCGKSLEGSKIELDHIIAVCLGGPNTLENLQLAHPACNRRAGIETRRLKYGY